MQKKVILDGYSFLCEDLLIKGLLVNPVVPKKFFRDNYTATEKDCYKWFERPFLTTLKEYDFKSKVKKDEFLSRYPTGILYIYNILTLNGCNSFEWCECDESEHLSFFLDLFLINIKNRNPTKMWRFNFDSADEHWAILSEEEKKFAISSQKK